MMAEFNIGDYNTVPERIAEFREKHPQGSLQQVGLEFRDFAGKSWVIYTAAAFRTPDDPKPGHGTAWEPVPGKTPFTRDSELQNAETAAWGRAIVAVLAADVKKGISTGEEVRNRQHQDEPQHNPATEARRELAAAAEKAGLDLKEVGGAYLAKHGVDVKTDTDVARIRAFIPELVLNVTDWLQAQESK